MNFCGKHTEISKPIWIRKTALFLINIIARVIETQKYKARYGSNLILVGHSLGGGLASLIPYTFGTFMAIAFIIILAVSKNAFEKPTAI